MAISLSESYLTKKKEKDKDKKETRTSTSLRDSYLSKKTEKTTDYSQSLLEGYLAKKTGTEVKSPYSTFKTDTTQNEMPLTKDAYLRNKLTGVSSGQNVFTPTVSKNETVQSPLLTGGNKDLALSLMSISETGKPLYPEARQPLITPEIKQTVDSLYNKNYTDTSKKFPISPTPSTFKIGNEPTGIEKGLYSAGKGLVRASGDVASLLGTTSQWMSEIGDRLAGRKISEKNALAEYFNNINKTADTLYNSMDMATDRGTSAVGNFVNGAIENFTYLVPTIASSLMSGGGTAATGAMKLATPVKTGIQYASKMVDSLKGMGTFMAQAAGGYMQDSKDKGDNVAIQMLKGTYGGLLEGITETIPFGYLEKLLGISGTKELAKRGIKQILATYGKDALANIITNIAQEVVVDPLAKIGTGMIGGTKNKLLGAGGILDPETAEQSALGALGLSLITIGLGLPIADISHVAKYENFGRKLNNLKEKLPTEKGQQDTPQATPVVTPQAETDSTTTPQETFIDEKDYIIKNEKSKGVTREQLDKVDELYLTEKDKDRMFKPNIRLSFWNTDNGDLAVKLKVYDKASKKYVGDNDYVIKKDGTITPKVEDGTVDYKHNSFLSEEYKPFLIESQKGGQATEQAVPETNVVNKPETTVSKTETVPSQFEGTKPGEAGKTENVQTSIVKQELPFEIGTGTDITKRSDIEKFISDSFDIPVAQGKFRQRAYGIFKVKPEVIRLKKTKDLPTLFHETGHFLDKKLGLSGIATTEVQKLGMRTSLKSYTKKQIVGEGIAEFVREYVIDKNNAKKLAPELYDVFEKKLESDQELKKVLATVSQATQNYMSQSPETRILSNVSMKDKPTHGVTLSRLYELLIDDLAPIERAVKEATGGATINTNRNPYELARLYKGVAGRAMAYLEYGPIDENFNKVGKPLSKILEPVVNELDSFRAYLIAKRVLEVAPKGKETGIAKADATATVEKYDDKYSKIADEVYEFKNAVLKQLVDQEVISEKFYETLVTESPNHIPFYRVMETFERRGKGKGLQSRNPIMKFKGSTRDIIDPLESIIKDTFVITDLAERNRIMIAMDNLTKDYEGTGGKIWDSVPPPMKAQSFELNEIENVLLNAGLTEEQIDDIDMDRMATIFRPTKYGAKDNIVTVFRKGKPKYKEVFDESLFRAILSLDKQITPMLTKILAFPAKLVRAGAILNPSFMAKNPTRDALTAYSFSKYGFIPGVDTARGLFHALGKDDLYYKWLASGAAQSAFISVDRNYLQNELRNILRTKGQKALDVFKHPLALAQAVSELSEETTRVGVFERGVGKEGLSSEGIRRAGLASKEASVDFSKGGSLSREINKLVPFFKVALLGPEQMYRSFKARPISTTVKALAMFTLPSILLWFRNKDDERYQELPQWQKDLFWIILTKDKIIKIPKPFEIGTLFATIPERIMQYIYEEDKSAFKGLGNTLANTFLPDYLPAAFKPIVEAVANYSFFKGYSIVPQSEQRLENWAQYNMYTSDVAKLIGKALNISPRIVDNTIYGYGSGLSQYGVDIVDVILELTGLVDKKVLPQKSIEEFPFISAFTAKAYKSSQSVEELYNRREELQKKKNTDKKLPATLQKELNKLNKAADKMSEIRDKITATYESLTIPPKEKRLKLDEYYKDLAEIARNALNKE